MQGKNLSKIYWLESGLLVFVYTAKTQYRKFSTKIFPEKELCDLSPNFHIYASVSNLYIPMIGLTILLQEHMWTDPGKI